MSEWHGSITVKSVQPILCESPRLALVRKVIAALRIRAPAQRFSQFRDLNLVARFERFIGSLSISSPANALMAPTTPLVNAVNQSDLGATEGQKAWASLAEKYWAKSVKTKVKNEVIQSELWDVLEQHNFEYRSLLILESLQLLEK